MKRGEWRLQKTPGKEEKVESNQQEKKFARKGWYEEGSQSKNPRTW